MLLVLYIIYLFRFFQIKNVVAEIIAYHVIFESEIPPLIHPCNYSIILLCSPDMGMLKLYEC